MLSSTKRGVNRRKRGADSRVCLQVSSTLQKVWSTAGYERIVRSILKQKYFISLVLIGDKKAKGLNKIYRNKSTPANVLTFPLGDGCAEIFINVSRAKKESVAFSLTPASYSKYLLIHACLHLKGMTHGSTMEKAERDCIKRFKLR